VALAAALISACEPPLHPKNDAIPELVCRPRCQRRHDCDPSVDVTACINRCVSERSPRMVYENMDFVAKLEACAQKQACTGDVNRSIGQCWRDASLRWDATPRARAFCEGAVAKAQRCGAEFDDYPHCIAGEGVALYSEAILQQLTDCYSAASCKTYGRCVTDIVGGYVLAPDEDRIREFRARPVPHAATRIQLSGRVTEDKGTPVAGATVCILDHRELPCSIASLTGSYSLNVPAASEITLVATAPGFGGRAVPLATPSRELSFDLVLYKDAILRARSEGFGLAYGDTSSGSLHVTVHDAQGKNVGMEGVALSLRPTLGKGPLYFAPTSDPDPTRKATSSWSTGMFAELPAGLYEVTLGPAGITCTPEVGGWPSAAPNTVRVSVVADRETSIEVRCAWNPTRP
jgi:hypothetical protein